MTAISALSKSIRTILVLTLIGLLAFGSQAGPVSAATAEHHFSVVASDDDRDQSDIFAAMCPASADGASHDMGDGGCCVGTGATVLGILPVADAPALRISEIEPFDPPVSAQSCAAEFLRPPSLTI